MIELVQIVFSDYNGKLTEINSTEISLKIPKYMETK